MIYLVDTDVLSEIRKGPRCHPNVAAWFSDVADVDLCLSVLATRNVRDVEWTGVSWVNPFVFSANQ